MAPTTMRSYEKDKLEIGADFAPELPIPIIRSRPTSELENEYTRAFFCPAETPAGRILV